MTERPILMSAPMVRAILGGTKTQTRRVVKGAPDDWAPIGPETFSPTIINRHGNMEPGPDAFGAGNEDGDCWIYCTHGRPGDRLWIKETFFAWGRWETRFSAKKGRDEWHFVDMTLECGRAYAYAADGAPHAFKKGNQRGGVTPSWWKRPAIFMPRAASRITLEVTEVRVERLQDISRGDAMAEGCPFPNMADGDNPRHWYADLWNSINGNGPGSWDSNPWVWCVGFRGLP